MSFKSIVKKLAKPFRGLIINIFELECLLSSKWVSNAHNRLMRSQWNLGENPEFFDHHIDLFFRWTDTRNPYWLERGVLGRLCMRPGSKVLELGCGDGFNSRNFYSIMADSIVACDFDQDAITIAKKKNSTQNTKSILADIRKNMPDGIYDNIVWDASIEHFTPDEIVKIMANIKARLKPEGVLNGYTLVEKSSGEKHIHQHEYEFKDMEDLKQFLSPHFRNVTVFETVYPERHNLYFWASDGELPFSDGWKHWIRNKHQNALANALV